MLITILIKFIKRLKIQKVCKMRTEFYRKRNDLNYCLECEHVFEITLGGGLVDYCPNCKTENLDNIMLLTKNSEKYKNYWRENNGNNRQTDISK